MDTEKLILYIDKLKEIYEKHNKIVETLYDLKIDIINLENDAINLLFDMIADVFGFPKTELEIYIISPEEVQYFKDNEPINFSSTREFVNFILEIDK